MAFRRSDARRTAPQQRGARLHQSLVRTCARSRFNVYTAERPIDPGDYRALLPWDQDGSISGPWQYGLPSQPRPRGLCCSIEGRDTVVAEIIESPRDLREYLAQAAKSLLTESRFLDVLPGFVLDNVRVPLIVQRLTSVAGGTRG